MDNFKYQMIKVKFIIINLQKIKINMQVVY